MSLAHSNIVCATAFMLVQWNEWWQPVSNTFAGIFCTDFELWKIKIKVFLATPNLNA